MSPDTPPHLPFDPHGDVVTTDRLNAYMDEGRPMLNNYIRHAKIGKGQHGEVHLCYQTNPGLPLRDPNRRIPVAMKSVKRDNARETQLQKLRQQRLPTTAHTALADRLGTMEAKIRKEIAIMKKCRHPHVVRLYEVIDDRLRDKVYMVMEYLGGGEVKWCNDRDEPILTLAQTRRIMRDAVLGLEYLHHQGIIHRDIKPANLLWTEDRRQVKIADFGTSHFSHTLFLAASGGGPGSTYEDPILLNETDLLKRDGTPKFMAPEIVFEHTFDLTPVTAAGMSMSLGDITSSSGPNGGPSTLPHVPTSKSLNSANTRPRPPITKAIDVWALGVTFYCLLFGKTPFSPDPMVGSEWSLYNAIANNDWDVDEIMGTDRVSTGGRHPGFRTAKGKERERDSENLDEGIGAEDLEGSVESDGEEEDGRIVVRLLERFLDKDPATRVGLDEVKRNPWILTDLDDPATWLQLTEPRGKIDVSLDETSVAMSSVHFSWNWGQVSRRISSLFRRNHQSSTNQHPPAKGKVGQRPATADSDAGRGFRGVRSEPNVRVRRYRSSGPAGVLQGHEPYHRHPERASPERRRREELGEKERERTGEKGKGKQRTADGLASASASALALVKDKGKGKSMDHWPPERVLAIPTTPSKGTAKNSRSTSALQDAVAAISSTSLASNKPQDNGGGWGRRGSVTALFMGGVGADKDKGRNSASSYYTPHATSSQASSPTTTTTTTTTTRGRLSMWLSSISHWRPTKYVGSTVSSPVDYHPHHSSPGANGTVTIGTTPATVMGRLTPSRMAGKVMRRSEEALRHYHQKASGPGPATALGTIVSGKGKGKGKGDSGGVLTNERRASSWGQGDQPMEFQEVLSLSTYDLRSEDPHLQRSREDMAPHQDDDFSSSQGGRRTLASAGPSSSSSGVVYFGARRNNGIPGYYYPTPAQSPSTSSFGVHVNGTTTTTTTASSGIGIGIGNGPIISVDLNNNNNNNNNNNAATAASVDEEKHHHFGGPACLEDDSSTIASAFGDADTDADDHIVIGSRRRGAGARERERERQMDDEDDASSVWRGAGDSENFEEEEEEDSEDEVPVTFSPRKRGTPRLEGEGGGEDES